MDITLKQLSEQLGIGFSGIGETIITHVCGLEEIKQGGLAYITDPREIANLPTPTGIFSSRTRQLSEIEISDQAAVIVPAGMTSHKHNLLYSPDPMLHHCQAAVILHEGSPKSCKVADRACIGHHVTIGKGVTIDANAVLYDHVTVGDNTVIRAGVVIMDHTAIGDDCLIYPNVTIRENCVVGNRVILHPGVVIGADGFGFFQRDGKNIKIPQVGSVEIGDDVEIGANTTIDRARFSRTVIGRGSKLDNLVHIAHNVELGEEALIAAQSGIAGSTKTGHHLMMGGQSGVRDNLKIGSNVTLLARTLITSRTNDNATVAGMPSRPIEVWRKIQALINSLDNLFERMKRLEASLKNRRKE
jgi:UDP-3-O-[3-hydroxymyristoyl] glucosamine N-acyltransferase